MNNQRGGILSTVFIIPAGVALMVGFFFLGYYVGKYQTKKPETEEKIAPLPEVESKSAPEQEEFTFYKTLTDKESRTVSIDLKPKSSPDESRTEKKTPPKESGTEKPAQSQKEQKAESKSEKPLPSPAKKAEPRIQSAKKETAGTHPASEKTRYTLQIAAYQEKPMAEDDVKKLKQKGYAAFIVSTELQGKGTWYRVRVGSFSNKTAAEKLQKELKAKAGVTPFITVE